jgi:hypothetical protein
MLSIQLTVFVFISFAPQILLYLLQNINTVKLGYNEQLGTDQICSL